MTAVRGLENIKPGMANMAALQRGNESAFIDERAAGSVAQDHTRLGACKLVCPR